MTKRGVDRIVLIVLTVALLVGPAVTSSAGASEATTTAAQGTAPFPGADGPQREGAGLEHIFNGDDRSRFTPTDMYPRSAVGLLVIRFGGEPRPSECTGTLIGPRTVLTAAHCLFRSAEGGQPDRFPASVRFIAAKDAGLEPYGSCRAVRVFVLPRYPSGEDDDDDIGAVKLNCNVGRRAGWWGVVPANWTNLAISFWGYPGDKPQGQMWASQSGMITSTRATEVWHTADAVEGNSGTALARAHDPPGPLVSGVYITAVHAAERFFPKRNVAARITGPRVRTIIRWINA